MSYTRGVVLHIWHGDRANRDYKNRYNIMTANKYNPGVDVRINEAGVLGGRPRSGGSTRR